VPGKRTFSGIFEVVRPLCVFLVAIAVVASVVAMKGWVLASFLLVGATFLVGVLLVIQTYRQFNSLHQRTSMIAEAASRAEQHYVEVLWRIIQFVEARDDYMQGHSERVGELSEKIARKLGMAEEKCKQMMVAGRLHDIGMVAIPSQLVAERARLGVDGFRAVTKHPEIGYEVLRPLQSLSEVLPAILHHHERNNGTGYPGGLAGEEIPLEARILAVADAYDAMTHDRPHRPAMTPLAAMEELRRCTPAGYDPACVKVLSDIFHLSRLRDAQGAAVGS